ncbi:hypothetical protein CCR96_21690 [Halochromatium roseum]|nr:hypothetical protein [Halochromatium roseum]
MTVKDRMERFGMCWTVTGAHVILQLTSVGRSELWGLLLFAATSNRSALTAIRPETILSKR